MRTWKWGEKEIAEYRRGPYPPGPWDDEPDKAQWVDERTGLDCLIVRGPMGALCGYVGVPKDHPFHGIPYNGCVEGCDPIPESMAEEPFWYCDGCDHSPDGRIDVHGGLTYSEPCQEDVEEGQGICHIPESGRPDDVYWFGFDCAHAFDLTPNELKYAMQQKFKYPFTDPRERSQYRDFAYVKEEVTNLARQLYEAQHHVLRGF